MEHSKCGECSFYAKETDDKGWCHLRPPRLFMVTIPSKIGQGRNAFLSVYPTVGVAAMGCDGFKVGSCYEF
jgi:hypothetical protein